MTYEEFLHEQLQEGRATPHGYHFFQLFNHNKWEWFTRWVLGIRPKTPSKSLILGSSIHKALDALYTFGHEQALHFIPTYFKWAEQTYGIQLQEQLTFAQDMLYAYLNNLHNDEAYHTVDTEKELTFQLPNKFPMTCRIDRIVEDREGRRFLVEVKTTGWSVPAVATQVTLEDQVTTYLYAARANNLSVNGVLLEVLYRNPRGGTPTATRPTIVTRTEDTLHQWAIMMSGIVDDAYYRLTTFRKDPTLHNALYFFPRNGEASSRFGDDYSPLWVKGYTLTPTLPDSYTKDPLASEVIEQFIQEYERGRT